MVEDNKKFVTVSFFALGALIALTIHFLLVFLSPNFAFVSRIESSDLFSNGIPVVIGFVIFLALQFNKTTVDYTDGVIAELKKVVWPSRKDTGLMTVVVVIMLVISGVIIGLMDAAWAYMIHFFVK